MRPSVHGHHRRHLLRRTSPRALVLAVLILCAACGHKKTKAEQLEELDRAFQSGAVTKLEYDAKRSLLTGESAAAPAAAASTPADADADEPEPAPTKGCEDAEYRQRKDSGLVTRFYPAPENKVKRAALNALNTLAFIVHNSEGDEIDASKKRTKKGVIIGAGGERVTLKIESATQDGKAGTRVTATTQIPKTGLVAGKSWTNAVLAQITCDLKEVHK